MPDAEGQGDGDGHERQEEGSDDRGEDAALLAHVPGLGEEELEADLGQALLEDEADDEGDDREDEEGGAAQDDDGDALAQLMRRSSPARPLLEGRARERRSGS